MSAVRKDDGWECPHELRTVAMPGLATPADVLAQANARAEQAERDLTTSCDQTIAANARADRAVADNEALVELLKAYVEHHRSADPMDDNPKRHEEVECNSWMCSDCKTTLKAEALLKQPHPGSRFLELARIVEGLPKFTSIDVVQEGMTGFYEIWCVPVGEEQAILFAGYLSRTSADALARLLAWKATE